MIEKALKRVKEKNDLSKDEMIAAARRIGYEGHEDNEADSYLIAKWFSEYRL